MPALLAALLVSLLNGGGGLVGWLVLAQGLPEVYTWADYARSAPQTTRLLASNGEVLADLWEERRILIPPSDIPPLVRDAVLASEDADFLTHSGIDAVGILRALWVDLLAGRVVQGGSTITQQLAKNLFLSAERTVERKVKEAALAPEGEGAPEEEGGPWKEALAPEGGGAWAEPVLAPEHGGAQAFVFVVDALGRAG